VVQRENEKEDIKNNKWLRQRVVTYVPNQDERAECYVGGTEVREGNRWSCRKHRLYKSRYWQVVSITIAVATVLYENSNDLCTDMRFVFACISNVIHRKNVKIFDSSIVFLIVKILKKVICRYYIILS